MATRKIVYVVTKGVLGGAQRYVYDLAAALTRDQFEPVVAVGSEGSWLTEVCTAAGIRVVTIPALGRDISLDKDSASFGALIKLFKDERPDIVHLNSSKIGALGAVAARLAGVRRIIFTAHGWAFNEKRSTPSRFAFWLAHALTIVLCDRTIAVSTPMVRQAPLRWKMTTVRHGIKAPTFLDRGAARAALKLPDGFITGTIAELHTNKGIDILIDALQDMPENISSVIVGDGEQRTVLVERATRRGISTRLTFAGHIDGAARYLKAFDLFALPSRTESLGYVLLEAGLAGLPVVASKVGGIPEIIEDGVTGLLVPPENPHALAAAISRVATDSTLGTALGNALKAKVEKEFSFERMLKETVALY